MDNASDADLKQVVEDPEDAPLVEAAAELPAEDVSRPSPHGEGAWRQVSDPVLFERSTTNSGADELVERNLRRQAQ